MKLKAVYANTNEIPDNYRDLYSEHDGKSVISNVEGLCTQEDVDRLQESLSKERADHRVTRKKLAVKESDLSVDTSQRRANHGDVQDVDTLNTLQIQLSESQSTIAELNQALSLGRLKEEIRKVALEQNILPVAIDDVLLLAEQTFEIDANGQTVTKRKIDVDEGLGADQWLDRMKDLRPHWWPASISAGANGGARHLMQDNPWSKASWNLTEQGQILRANPDRARSLASAAGVKLAI